MTESRVVFVEDFPDVGMTETQLVEAYRAVEVATRRYPTLDRGGFATDGDPLGVSPSNRASIATAITYLRQCAPVKTPRLGSYGLKHAAECWGRDHGMAPYVANGDLIAAAIYLEFPVTPYGGRNPNAKVGVSRRSVRTLLGEL